VEQFARRITNMTRTLNSKLNVVRTTNTNLNAAKT